jgi:branched-chain amino acid transport system permease protein
MAQAVATPPISLMGELDGRRVLTWGGLIGLATVFVAIIGMTETFSDRVLLDPFLDLGDVSLLWIPVVFGYTATYRQALEGMEAPRIGAHNVFGGAVAGLIGAGIMGLFLVIFEAAYLRNIFPNASPELFELLTFGHGLGGGIAILAGAGTVLGAVGGAMHLLPLRLRNAITSGLLWVFAIALLKLMVVDLMEELPGTIEDLFYNSDDALRWGAAIVVFATFFAINYALSARQASLRTRLAALPEKERTGLGLVVAFLLIALGFALPTILNSFFNEILATVGLFMLMGLGLNIVIGLAGLLDLGYVAFFAVGAYTTAVLTSPSSPKIVATLPFILVVPLVILTATVAGIFVGTPVIRMRGDYLAIVTLGFGEIARILFLSDWLKPTFGGAQGILSIPSVAVWRWLISVALLAAAAGAVWTIFRHFFREASRGSLRTFAGAVAAAVSVGAVVAATKIGFSGTFIVQGTKPQLIFYAIFVFAIIAAFVSWRLQDSRIGRAWMAMREDEQVAEAMGINTTTAKLLAFITGAVLASFGGALFAAKIGSVFPNSFALIVSIIVLVIIIVGGMGNIPGVALGALMLVGILGGPTQPGLLREFEGFKLLIYGALLIYMMLARPEGLLPSSRRVQELHQEEFEQDAWLKTLEAEQEGAS